MATEYACSKILSVIGQNAVMVGDLVIWLCLKKRLVNYIVMESK